VRSTALDYTAVCNEREVLADWIEMANLTRMTADGPQPQNELAKARSKDSNAKWWRAGKILPANRRFVTLQALLGIAADYWNILRQTKMPLNQPDGADESYRRALICPAGMDSGQRKFGGPACRRNKKEANQLEDKIKALRTFGSTSSSTAS
jgi:hypothetical protein